MAHPIWHWLLRMGFFVVFDNGQNSMEKRKGTEGISELVGVMYAFLLIGYQTLPINYFPNCTFIFISIQIISAILMFYSILQNL